MSRVKDKRRSTPRAECLQRYLGVSNTRIIRDDQVFTGVRNQCSSPFKPECTQQTGEHRYRGNVVTRPVTCESGLGNVGNLRRLAYFVSVVETGSFTAAAERLGVTKAVVSQQVARLEREFKTSLLVLTTRSAVFPAALFCPEKVRAFVELLEDRERKRQMMRQ